MGLPSLPNIYTKGNPMRYAAIPLALLVIALVLIFVKGIPTGIDFRGGLLFNIQTSGTPDLELIKTKLAPLSSEVNVRHFQGPNGNGIEIELSANPAFEEALTKLREARVLETQLLSNDAQINTLESSTAADAAAKLVEAQKVRDKTAADLNAKISEILTKTGTTTPAPSSPYDGLKFAEGEVDKAQQGYRDRILSEIRTVVDVQAYTFKEVGASLSQVFLNKAREILTYAFILAAILVFAIFRSFAPSLAVFFGATADIVLTLGAMALFSIPLSLSSVTGLLMLVGLSLDTDVLLTVRVLKRTEGLANQRAYEAMKTGFLMNATTIAAFTVLAVVGYLTGITTYTELGLVVVLGGFMDFIATWMVNAPLVLRVAHQREGQRA